MIGAILGAASLAAQVAVGCLQVAWGVAKIGTKVTRKLAKGGWKAYKKTKRLGKGVLKVIRQSRSITRGRDTSPILNKSHLFTEPSKVESVISNSRAKSSGRSEKSRTSDSNKIPKSNIFNKKDK